jgi:hypothetical protein
MAIYIGLGFDEPIEDSELRVANALKKLPDDWIILHHVSWQSKRGGREGDGEADFIVLHPYKGMLVLEVKGGGINVEMGRWFTINRHGTRHSIKNPYEQAVASKHALVAWLRGHGLGLRVRVGHAVAFPHMQSLPLIGPAAIPEISLAKSELEDIDIAITRCFDHWKLEANMSPAEVNQVVALLAPTISIVPGLSDQSSDAEAKILVFTAEQIEVFAGLRANRGGLILGRAGTGKTILAIARAQQLAQDGFHTLLICYNELLGSDLATRTHTFPQLKACTFHALCLREAHQAKLQVPKLKSPEWWEKIAPNLLIEASAINETRYDAVVVDEGQDFSPLWLDSLRRLLSAQADTPFFIFADPLQDIWKRDWSHGSEYSFTWKLNRNMRNTQPIAARVAATMKIECQDRGVSGPIPTWQLSEGMPREKDVLSAVERLLNEGFGPSNLVVLCGSASLVAQLRERSVGSYSFGQRGGRGIAVETISRFKGLEEQAIVLALSSIPESEDRIEAYVGMSRARSVLLVIGSEADRQALNWPIEKP